MKADKETSEKRNFRRCKKKTFSVHKKIHEIPKSCTMSIKFYWNLKWNFRSDSCANLIQFNAVQTSDKTRQDRVASNAVDKLSFLLQLQLIVCLW